MDTSLSAQKCSKKTSIMYQVGDYVYVETTSSNPYSIRKIEAFRQEETGTVAEVMCFYRRRDLPVTLLQKADKHMLDTTGNSSKGTLAPAPSKNQTLKETESKLREVFLARKTESVSITQIRGKCSVMFLNDPATPESFLNEEDSFYYCLVYDPNKKFLHVNTNDVRIGKRYQCEIPDLLEDPSTDDRQLEQMETKVWGPDNLSDRKIDQFLVVSRSVGTYARALETGSSNQQPSLHASAAAASRDITLFHAMDLLHKNKYSIEEAVASLVPSSGPLLCRDEKDDWSDVEAHLFKEGMEKYAKDFNKIRLEFLPWKKLTQVVEYYYMRKNSAYYEQRKKEKSAKAQLKPKQVFIKSESSDVDSGAGETTNGDTVSSSNEQPCGSCALLSAQWHPFTVSGKKSRLCKVCWEYWKKYGGLKNATVVHSGAGGELKTKTTAREVNKDKSQALKCEIVNCGKEFRLKNNLRRHYAQAHGISITSGSSRPIMQTRTPFCFETNLMIRLARNICSNIIKAKKAARKSSFKIDGVLVKQELIHHLKGQTLEAITKMVTKRNRERPTTTEIANLLASLKAEDREFLNDSTDSTDGSFDESQQSED